MKEIKAIINAYDKIKNTGVQAALATVVRVEGSSYRRTGARMLVMEDGVWIGGISGGCLEGDALKKARLAIAQSASSLMTYDTTEDDAYQIGVGLGCNGIIDVLFTPLDFKDKNNPVEILKSCADGNRQVNILITITGMAGEWKHVKPGDVIQYTSFQSLSIFEDSVLENILQEKISRQIENNRSAPYQFEKGGNRQLSVFIEILPPETHLVLMGHQYDVYPLARLAKEAGCKITIVANPLKLNSKFSDTAFAIVPHDRFNETVTDQFTAIVLMSHDFKSDKANLLIALQTGVSYIGVLGPRVRSEKIFSELEDEGEPVTNKNMERIYAPAGLDIGAVSPEEIALSIIAEIKTVFTKRDGGFLRLRHSPIHERN